MQIVRKIILFVCLFCPVTIYAQWSFTGTVNGEGGGMGNMCVLDKKYAESQVSSYSGKQFATQSECEKARQYVMNSVSAGCKDYIIVSCSPCTGAGGVTGSVSGSNFGDFDWFGTKPFASTNDYLDNLTLKENFDRYMEALSSIMDEYNTRDWGLPTGDLEYDAERVKQYSDLMNNRDFIVKKGVAPKGRGIVMNRTNNSIYSFTPRLFEKPETYVLDNSSIDYYIPKVEIDDPATIKDWVLYTADAASLIIGAFARTPVGALTSANINLYKELGSYVYDVTTGKRIPKGMFDSVDILGKFTTESVDVVTSFGVTYANVGIAKKISKLKVDSYAFRKFGVRIINYFNKTLNVGGFSIEGVKLTMSAYDLSERTNNNN